MLLILLSSLSQLALALLILLSFIIVIIIMTYQRVFVDNEDPVRHQQYIYIQMVSICSCGLQHRCSQN